MSKWQLLFGITTLVLIFFLYFEEDIRFGWGYSVNWLGGSEYNITKGEEIVVGGAIFDYQLVEGHLVGLRAPSINIQCGYKRMRVASDKAKYFILNLDEKSVQYFSSKNDFEKVIYSLSKTEVVGLRYSYIENIFNNEGLRLDLKDSFKKCLERYELSGQQVIWLNK
tara:strand:+ start:160 stop:660 length:501 start_codon:yes stop_codon:yes gene_type:complete